MNYFHLLALIFCIVQSNSIGLDSFHSHEALHLTLRIDPQQTITLYSSKIFENQNNEVTVRTFGDQAKFSPSIDNLILVNAKHEQQYIVQFYEKRTKTQSTNFYHLSALKESTEENYLIPLFSQKMSAINTDYLFKCSKILIALEKISGHAKITIFGKQHSWHVKENIDDGFRSLEDNIAYGMIKDFDNQNHIRIDIGNHEYCMLNTDAHKSKINHNWKKKASYSLEDILELVEISLQIQVDEESDL